MNLETFKARARRKLELPARTAEPSAVSDRTSTVAEPTPSVMPMARSTDDHSPERQTTSHEHSASQHQANDMTPPNAPATTRPDTPPGANRFAAALSSAAKTPAPEVTAKPRKPVQRDPRSENFAAKKDASAAPAAAAPTKLESPAGFAARAPASSTDSPSMSSDTQLAHLRSLLLGNQPESQQEQIDAVYRRTQSGLNVLRRDMDARLTDLSEYVEQLEQSLLNSIDNQNAGLSDDTTKVRAQHEQRLDSLEARVSGLLETTRAELDERQTNDRKHLETELTAASERSDRMLNEVSERLERSIAELQTNISEQLSSQSADALAAPQNRISELRETLIAHTNGIKAELKIQTQEQSAQLATHREEMEAQFNRAITTLNTNKVSHSELSQLLSRLADRIQQL